jgi:hypothetical protein
LFFSIIAYTVSSTKLEIRAKYFLPGIKGVGGRGRERGGENGGGGGLGEMTQTLYAHMNKKIIIIKINSKEMSTKVRVKIGK